MIKLQNVPKEVMDVVMPVARQTGKRPDEVIKIMLGLVKFDDAMRAVNYEQENTVKK
ncbi:hypothetical protein KUA24_64 [Vibrio phage HNL01]|nr:hypothetical protein KUA24_64 [Vibrio phage HNL01]